MPSAERPVQTTPFPAKPCPAPRAPLPTAAEAVPASEPSAAARLFPLVYDELRRLAAMHLRLERPGHTLQPTALVHEAFLRIMGRDASLNDAAHFFAVAAEAMRHVLVDHARRRLASKRGLNWRRVTIDESALMAPQGAADVLAIHEALQRLTAAHQRPGRMVELRFFGGLSIAQAADVLGVSRKTATEDWRLARAWLSRDLSTTGHQRGSHECSVAPAGA